MYKAVIFDLDGTILDTLEDLCASVNYALLNHNFPPRTIDEVREFVGNGIKKLIERAVPCNTDEQTVELVLDTFKKHYSVNSDVNTKPYAGITDCLEKLKQEGIKIAVVTNKAHFAAVPLCQKYFGKVIDVTIGEREGVRKKPYPDTVFEAMEHIGVKSSECVYIGDSDVDIQTAKNAGIDCISVTWGFRSEEFLKSFGAVNIVNNVEDMYGLIKKAGGACTQFASRI